MKRTKQKQGSFGGTKRKGVEFQEDEKKKKRGGAVLKKTKRRQEETNEKD